jgi:hypothetical protein
MSVIRWGVRILFLSVTMIAAVTAVSAAQTVPQLEQLQIDLWPEFDRPDMLVIYRGTLPPEAPLPATVTLRLPQGVEAPHAVAYVDSTGNLFDATHSATTTEDGVTVTLETLSPNFQLEFYDALTRDGDQRSYTLVWPGDYAVNQLNIVLLPPPGATQIQTEPALSFVQQESGVSTYVGTLGGRAENQTARISVNYRGGTAGVAGTLAQSSDGDSRNYALIAGAIVVVLVLVIGSVVWYTRQQREQPKTVSRRQRRTARRRQRETRTVATQNDPSQSRYCTHCGRALRADDRFCGNCGTPVKGKTGSPEQSDV